MLHGHSCKNDEEKELELEGTIRILLSLIKQQKLARRANLGGKPKGVQVEHWQD
jgi:hypothetical protein